MIKEERLDNIEKFITAQHYASVDALAAKYENDRATLTKYVDGVVGQLRDAGLLEE